MAYYRCTGNSGGSLKLRTVQGDICTFEPTISEPLVNVKCELTPSLDGYSAVNVQNCNNAFVPLWSIDNTFRGTVVFNQLFQNGNFENTSYWSASDSTISASDNVLSCNFSSANYARFFHSTIQVTLGHKYILMFSCKSDSAGSGKSVYCPYTSTPLTYASVNTFVINETWKLCASIFTPNSTASAYIGSGKMGYSTEFTAQYKNFMLIDLTAMFGSTIADYIYSLEQNESGAGVAFFRSMYPDDYYSYDVGTTELIGTNLASISLGDTYYGGTLDVTRGVLTVTHSKKVFNGTERWYYSSTYNRVYTAMADAKTNAYFISDTLTNSPAIADYNAYINDQHNIIIYAPASITSADDWKNWLENNNISITYELATPFDINLTPEVISAVVGTNNVFADCGQTELKYLTLE